MNGNEYSNLNPDAQKLLLDAHKENVYLCINHINSKSNVLFNWLYALSTGGFVMIIGLMNTSYGKHIFETGMWKYTIWFFISLFLCVASNALEWWRFRHYLSKITSAIKKFTNNEFELKEYVALVQENKWWIRWVSSLVVCGYLSLFIGIARLIF